MSTTDECPQGGEVRGAGVVVRTHLDLDRVTANIESLTPHEPMLHVGLHSEADAKHLAALVTANGHRITVTVTKILTEVIVYEPAPREPSAQPDIPSPPPSVGHSADPIPEQAMRSPSDGEPARTPQAYLAAAEDALDLAHALAGQDSPAAASGRAFLLHMARSDALVDHDAETCGVCHQRILWAQVARALLAEGEALDAATAMERWSAETERRAAIRTRHSRRATGSRERGEPTP